MLCFWLASGTTMAWDQGDAVPTVLRWNGYRFYFFSNEGAEPPHIHIDKGGSTAKV